MEALVPNIEQARTYIGIAFTILLTIVLLAIPVYTKLRDAIVTMIGPALGKHDSDPEAHSNIRNAISLLEGAVSDLQRQINTESAHRKESLEQVHQQLDTAIRLLRE